MTSDEEFRDDSAPALEAALEATLADLEQVSPVETGDGTGDINTSVHLHFGRLIADPAVLAHVKLRLSAAEAQDEHEMASRLHVIARSLEAAQAMDADKLAHLVESVVTFRATMEALNAYVGATSMEAAYEVLKRQSDLLATDLAVDLIIGKVDELRDSGKGDAAQQLERGPLRLVRDVREHGLERGYQVFLDRDRQQEDAKTRLGFLIAAATPDLLDAVDAVMAADGVPALARALEEGCSWLVRPEAAMIMREGATITGAGGTSDEDASRLTYLATLLERMSAVAHDEPQLSAYECVQWALAAEPRD